MAEGEVGAVAPVATVPGTQPVSAPIAPTDGNQAPPTEGDKPVAKTYTDEDVKKLINERLSKERRRIERTTRAEVERDYYRNLAENPRQAPVADKPKGRPQAKDFQTVEDFMDADYTWRREREKESEARDRQVREPKEREQQSAQEYSRSLQEKLADDGSGKYEDFEEVVFADDVPYTDPMVAAIHESAHPRDLAYYLATHPTDLRRIAKLPATHQVKELGKIEDKLAAPPKPTGTPPPIVPGGGNGAVKKDYADMTTEEHIKAYRNRNKRS